MNPITNDHHFLKEDRAVRWHRIAGLVRENPGNLDVALGSIARWLALGRGQPAPMLDWRERIVIARKIFSLSSDQSSGTRLFFPSTGL